MRRMTSMGTVAGVVVALVVVTAQGPPAAKTAPVKLSPDAEAVLELDRQSELALNRMDVEFLGKAFAEDLIFTHGDAWTNSNVVGNTNTKQVWLNSVKNSNGLYRNKNANSQRIEMHGDIAIVEGRSSGRLGPTAREPEHDYEIWYLRVYSKRDGKWQLISHKTVRGPQPPTNPT